MLKHLSNIISQIIRMMHLIFVCVISVAVRMKSFRRHSSQRSRNQSKDWILVIHLAFKRWQSKAMNPMAKVVIHKISNYYRQMFASNSSIKLSIIFVAHLNHHRAKNYTKAKDCFIIKWKSLRMKEKIDFTTKFITHTVKRNQRRKNGVRIREFCNEAIWIQYRYPWIHAIHFTKAHLRKFWWNRVFHL